MSISVRTALVWPLLIVSFALQACGGPGSNAADESGEPGSSGVVTPAPDTGGDPFEVGSESGRAKLEGFVIDYEGPDCGVLLEERTLRIRVEAPTGGHRLSFDSATEAGGGIVTVVCRLDEPNPETSVTQALETLSLDLDIGELSEADPRGYVIRVVRWVDGFEYLIPPEARIAATLSR